MPAPDLKLKPPEKSARATRKRKKTKRKKNPWCLTDGWMNNVMVSSTCVDLSRAMVRGDHK